MDKKLFSLFLKEMRLAKGLTQQQIAEKLSVTDKAVSKWERGLSVPDVELFPQLANVLGITISEMYNVQRKNTNSSDLSNKYDVEVKDDEPEYASVRLAPSGRSVSPLLFGNNLEHTRGSVYGGLSAEMIKNRKFAGKPSNIGCSSGWYPIGEKVHLSMSKAAYTKHLQPEKMRRLNECNAQRIHNLFNLSPCGIGQHGIYLNKEQHYEFEIVMRADQPTEVEIALLQKATGKPYEKISFDVANVEWETYRATFFPGVDDEDADIAITFGIKGAITIGAVSLLPEGHFHGMRRDVVDLLKETGVSVLRWPGGNFAGEYRWEDGLLPRNQRGPLQAYNEIETQPWSDGYDFHEINTDDFIALCREIGALPFLTVNPAWDSPEECAHWVEYCNGDATTEYGKLRIERGFTEPYNVLIWSLGNEFGYGHMEGANTPVDYSIVVRKCAEAMEKVTDNITFVSSGPYPNELWSHYSALPLADIAPVISYHCYTPYMSVKDMSEDVNFSDLNELKRAYLTMVNGTECMKTDISNIRQHTKNKVKICFDEWNIWYEWYRTAGTAEAIYAAKVLHMLMKNADDWDLLMACYFEMVNEGGIQVQKGTAKLTPLGEVFSVMKKHINGEICYTDESDSIVATQKEGVTTLTAVNASFDKTKTVCVENVSDVMEEVLLYSDSVLPFSEFEIKHVKAEVKDHSLLFEIPAHSVYVLRFASEKSPRLQ